MNLVSPQDLLKENWWNGSSKHWGSFSIMWKPKRISTKIFCMNLPKQLAFHQQLLLKPNNTQILIRKLIWWLDLMRILKRFLVTFISWKTMIWLLAEATLAIWSLESKLFLGLMRGYGRKEINSIFRTLAVKTAHL